jgi:hypothetical protein
MRMLITQRISSVLAFVRTTNLFWRFNLHVQTCPVRRVLSCVAAMCVIPSNSFAQSPAPSMSPPASVPDTGRRSLVLTVKGGVSLGSYQAGLVWASMQLLKSQRSVQREADSLAADLVCARRQKCIPLDTLFAHRTVAERNQIELRAATGASAGNINALLAALDWCSSVRDSVAVTSSFYRIWTDVGLEGLLQETTERSMLSRAPLESAWQAFEGLLDQRVGRTGVGCDIPLGMSVTRLAPMTVRNASGVAARTSRGAVSFRLVADPMTGTLAFVQPRVKHAKLGDAFGILLLTDSATLTQTIRRPVVQQAVLASAAFPVAWAPKSLHYIRGARLSYSPNQHDSLPVGACGKRPLAACVTQDSGLFVDGGVFAN